MQPLSPIENTNRTRRRSSPISYSRKDLPSPRNIFRLSTQCKEEEEKTENNEHEFENIPALLISSETTINSSITLRKSNKTEMESHELPNFSNISPIKKAPKHNRDSSFQTQETLPESDSEDSGSSLSSSVCSKQSVRFADEVGLPIQSIMHYECQPPEHSELLVLCLCPIKKTFEFLHVGYHGATLVDLLSALPGMCTNEVFGDSKFTFLYRNSGLAFENLCEEPESETITLRECGFRENEVVVAAVEGSPRRAVLEGIGPLLGNAKIRKTLKRARRSRRGLKFVRAKSEREDPYHLQKRRDLSLRRKNAKKETKRIDVIVPKIEPDAAELVDEYCHDYDPLYDVAEYHKHLLLGILAIGSGTVVFSALGL